MWRLSGLAVDWAMVVGMGAVVERERPVAAAHACACLREVQVSHTAHQYRPCNDLTALPTVLGFIAITAAESTSKSKVQMQESRVP